jgi:flagellar export protein FliJ
MASKKPFHLRTVLRYKQQLEERLQGELARLTQALAEAEAVCVQQREQRESCLALLHMKERSGLPAAELFMYSAFVQQLSTEMAQQAQVIADLREAVKKARQRLEQAMKDGKIIENLQEKARTTQKQQTLKEEERTLGEMALRRFAS